MSRAWWWKTAGIGLVTLLALLYLVPTGHYFAGLRSAPEGGAPASQPAAGGGAGSSLVGWLSDLVGQRKMQLGLDLQGGLHLVYEVHIDKAVSDKSDRMSVDIEDRLRKDARVKDATVTRSGKDVLVIKVKRPADLKAVDREFLRDFEGQLDEARRDAGKGTLELRMSSKYVAEIQDYALRQGIETIRGRVDKFGVAEPTIIRKGTDIVVELPGLSQRDFERVKNVIGRTAQLEFKMVDDGFKLPEHPVPYMQEVAEKVQKDGPITAESDGWTEKESGEPHSDVFLRAEKREDLEKFFASLPKELQPPATHEIGYEQMRAGDEGAGDTPGKAFWRTYLVKRRAEITGEYLTDAEVQWDPQTGRPEVGVTFNREGAGIFERLSGENIGRKMAIILDEKVNSAPVIESRIGGGRARITMGGMRDPMAIQQEARDLVAVLRTGALPAPLRKTFETQIGATLGSDAVQRAKTAWVVGGIAVILFMLVYYRASGIIASLAMFLNLLYMGAILAGFEATLTLPGIAGLVLTVGMAVDANIIIYERIREELRLGKSPRVAVDLGFERAFRAVLDGHVSNFVAGVVLYSYGSGPIRGFAVTLLVGIVTNLFTSVWVSRWMFDVMVGRKQATPAISI